MILKSEASEWKPKAQQCGVSRPSCPVTEGRDREVSDACLLLSLAGRYWETAV